MQSLVALLRAQPFRPFRIELTNGEVFDIRHPDMALPTLGWIHISRPPANDPDGFERVVIVSFGQVLKIEPLAPAKPASGVNGPSPWRERTDAPPDDELARLHADLNHSWLNPWWAKVEILLGLFAAGAGLLYGVHLAARPEAEVWPWAWAGPLVLFALGGYLALAGHRSHLYQSNNRLAAYLAGLIRSEKPGNPP